MENEELIRAYKREPARARFRKRDSTRLTLVQADSPICLLCQSSFA